MKESHLKLKERTVSFHVNQYLSSVIWLIFLIFSWLSDFKSLIYLNKVAESCLGSRTRI